MWTLKGNFFILTKYERMSKFVLLAGGEIWGHIYTTTSAYCPGTRMVSKALTIQIFSGILGLLALLSGPMVWVWQKRQSKRMGGRLREFLQDTVDAFHDGKIFFDEDENFIIANKKARELLPFLNVESQAPKSFSGFLDYLYDNAVDTDDGLIEALQRRASSSEMTAFREVILSGDNRFCIAEVVQTQHNRKIIRITDISALRDQEELVLRLRQYNNELFSAIEAATNGLMILKSGLAGSTVVFVNQTFCEIFDITKSEAIGARFEDFLIKIKDEEEKEQIIKILKNRKKGEALFRVMGPDQSVFWYNLKLTSNNDLQNLSIGVFNDLTELKKRESEFVTAQKLEALGQLAAGVAHDFNNVLSIIDGYTSMAARTLPADAPALSHLERVCTASKRAADLVKQMLTFSRHKIVTDSVIDLRQFVPEQETLLRPLLDASIHLDIQVSEDELCVQCSPDQVVQIVMNLAVNARDAMPNGGSLNVTARLCSAQDLPARITENAKKTSYACLSVADTGTGMPPEVIEKIFDPFFTTKEQGKGTGLGLSVVYGLVKQMGGFLDVHSTPGIGTTMSVFFPISNRRPSKSISGTVENIDTLCLDGFTALVAEDEPDLLSLVSGMLERLGMKVLKASNGSEALVLQEDYDGDVDILLTDVVMPEMNGVSLAEYLKELRPETKVIFMSGYPAAGQLARVKLPENAFFMAKPVHYEALARMVFERLREKTPQNFSLEEMKVAQWKSSETYAKGGQ